MEGEGYLNQELFAQESSASSAAAAAAPAGRRVNMLNVTEKHISAFNNVDGMLMVSPFIPDSLKGATWCARQRLQLPRCVY